MLELHKLDSDVLVGHNISGFDLDVLLHRFQVGILAFPQTISCQFLVNKLIFNNFKNITYIIMQQFWIRKEKEKEMWNKMNEIKWMKDIIM